MKTKSFRFQLKEVTDEGVFEGILSTYGNTDLGGDRVEPGAFTKSIAERGTEVPMLWSHRTDSPVGVLTLLDAPDALRVKGKLVLEVEKAREALALMRSGALKGLSIGYDVVKSTMENGVRVLKECRLWEGSLVVFPMNPACNINLSSVKSDEQKAEFSETLDNIQLWALRYQMISALDTSLDSIVYNRELSSEQKTAQIDTSINEFREKYLDFLPRWFALVDSYKKLSDLMEQKAGRRISAATRSQIEETVSKLQALLEDSAGDNATEESTEAASQKSNEPDIHSWLLELSTEIKENLPHAN